MSGHRSSHDRHQHHGGDRHRNGDVDSFDHPLAHLYTPNFNIHAWSGSTIPSIGRNSRSTNGVDGHHQHHRGGHPGWDPNRRQHQSHQSHRRHDDGGAGGNWPDRPGVLGGYDRFGMPLLLPPSMPPPAPHDVMPFLGPAGWRMPPPPPTHFFPGGPPMTPHMHQTPPPQADSNRKMRSSHHSKRESHSKRTSSSSRRHARSTSLSRSRSRSRTHSRSHSRSRSRSRSSRSRGSRSRSTTPPPPPSEPHSTPLTIAPSSSFPPLFTPPVGLPSTAPSGSPSNPFSYAGGIGIPSMLLEIEHVVGEELQIFFGEMIERQIQFDQTNIMNATSTHIDTSTMFTYPSQHHPYLSNLKQQLNSVKSCLNRKLSRTWSKHTDSTHLTGEVMTSVRTMIKEEDTTILNNAFGKMYEILMSYDLISNTKRREGETFRSLHLCEAPGGFISALHHYLGLHHPQLLKSWSWFGNTLRPSSELNLAHDLIKDVRLIDSTPERWLWCKDGSGNIMSEENIRSIWSSLDMCDLVTADGSIPCYEDPEEQELHTSKLRWYSTICSLGILRKGGCFVLKLFTLFETMTYDLLKLINLCFETCTLTKPNLSKAGNSEIYIVCQGFKGMERKIIETLLTKGSSMASKEWFKHTMLPPIDKTIKFDQEESEHDTPIMKFDRQYLKACTFFTLCSGKVIQRNLALAGDSNSNNGVGGGSSGSGNGIVPMDKTLRSQLDALRRSVTLEWLHRFKFTQLSNDIPTIVQLYWKQQQQQQQQQELKNVNLQRDGDVDMSDDLTTNHPLPFSYERMVELGYTPRSIASIDKDDSRRLTWLHAPSALAPESNTNTPSRITINDARLQPRTSWIAKQMGRMPTLLSSSPFWQPTKVPSPSSSSSSNDLSSTSISVRTALSSFYTLLHSHRRRFETSEWSNKQWSQRLVEREELLSGTPFEERMKLSSTESSSMTYESHLEMIELDSIIELSQQLAKDVPTSETIRIFEVSTNFERDDLKASAASSMSIVTILESMPKLKGRNFLTQAQSMRIDIEPYNNNDTTNTAIDNNNTNNDTLRKEINILTTPIVREAVSNEQKVHLAVARAQRVFSIRGGTFLLRTCDLLTRFGCGIFYIMSILFETTRIIRTCTASPIEPEVWLIGSGFQGCSEGMFTYLRETFQRMNDQIINNGGEALKPFQEDAPITVVELIPQVLLEQPWFHTYVSNMNTELQRSAAIETNKAVETLTGQRTASSSSSSSSDSRDYHARVKECRERLQQYFKA